MDIQLVTAYLYLGLTALLAATIVPFYSETLLVFFLEEGHSPFGLWASATIGNTLGAVVNWFLGRYALHFKDRRWFPISESMLKRSQAWFGKYGVWSLLFSWLPIGGDTLTLVAGVMRVNFWLFLLLAFLGKAFRYALAIWAWEAVVT